MFGQVAIDGPPISATLSKRDLFMPLLVHFSVLADVMFKTLALSNYQTVVPQSVLAVAIRY